jgi:hypothetical protein
VFRCIDSFCAWDSFNSKAKKMDKVDRPDTNKTDWIKLYIFIDPDKPAQGFKYSHHLIIFNYGWTEEYIKCLVCSMRLRIWLPWSNLLTWPESSGLGWRVKSRLILNHLRRRLEKEDSEIPDNDLIELVLRDVGLEFISKRTIRVQKYYMTQTGVSKWVSICLYNNLKKVEWDQPLPFSFSWGKSQAIQSRSNHWNLWSFQGSSMAWSDG